MPLTPHTGGRYQRELSDLVVVSRRIPDQAVRQREDPLLDTEGQRQAAAAGAEMRILQPDRVIGLQPHVNQRRCGQSPPAITLASQRDRPLLGVRAAEVMNTVVRDLAVAVVLTGKRHPVRPPRQQAAVRHQHRGMPRLGVRIAGQFGRALHHLLGHMAVLACQRPPLRPRLWLHCHPLCRTGAKIYCNETPERAAGEPAALHGWNRSGCGALTAPAELVGRARQQEQGDRAERDRRGHPRQDRHRGQVGGVAHRDPDVEGLRAAEQRHVDR